MVGRGLANEAILICIHRRPNPELKHVRTRIPTPGQWESPRLQRGSRKRGFGTLKLENAQYCQGRTALIPGPRDGDALPHIEVGTFLATRVRLVTPETGPGCCVTQQLARPISTTPTTRSPALGFVLVAGPLPVGKRARFEGRH